mmetsp:Transcript_46297/g.93457  ORF Transcript_46297/g.93457 Transcript_46297/m.93457 type:complete len:186 (-) Transcript_46297:217-774(-)
MGGGGVGVAGHSSGDGDHEFEGAATRNRASSMFRMLERSLKNKNAEPASPSRAASSFSLRTGLPTSAKSWAKRRSDGKPKHNKAKMKKSNKKAAGKSKNNNAGDGNDDDGNGEAAGGSVNKREPRSRAATLLPSPLLHGVQQSSESGDRAPPALGTDGGSDWLDRESEGGLAFSTDDAAEITGGL